MSVAGANENPALPKFHLISLNVIQHLQLNQFFFKMGAKKQHQPAKGILRFLKYYKKWNILFIPHLTVNLHEK